MGKLYQQVGQYLLSQGFGLLQARDYGVILGRGYQNYIV
jgi:hypothetical protein